jgi:putative hydrolase of the HAD superfamily
VVSVVLFDLDDTLFAHREAVEQGVLAHLDATGISGAPGTAARWSELEELHYSRYLAGELDYLGQRRARARDFLGDYGVALDDDSAAEAWFEHYLHSYRAAWALHDDTLPALDALASYRLGIITNGVTHFQQPKLERLGLAPYFAHIVTSGDFGAVKPDPSIFLHACSLFGVPPAEAAYVGDRLGTDALGAVGAGLAGVWLDRAGAATPLELDSAAEAGVAVIRTLAELPPLLLQLK